MLTIQYKSQLTVIMVAEAAKSEPTAPTGAHTSISDAWCSLIPLNRMHIPVLPPLHSDGSVKSVSKFACPPPPGPGPGPGPGGSLIAWGANARGECSARAAGPPPPPSPPSQILSRSVCAAVSPTCSGWILTCRRPIGRLNGDPNPGRRVQGPPIATPRPGGRKPGVVRGQLSGHMSCVVGRLGVAPGSA
jgi:hypothetical protein